MGFDTLLDSSTIAEGPEEPLLRQMEAEANLFSLASHIYWGVWSFVQARYSPIDFDYLTYSATRWSEYHKRKAEYMEAARRVFGKIP